MTRRSRTKPAAGVPLVSFRRVSRFFSPERAALFDISLDISSGEFLYVAGPSGAGKSTLLNLLHAHETPDTGTVYYCGHDIAKLKRTAVAVLRRSMGVVYQDYRLVPDLTLAANVGLPLEIAGSSRQTIRTRTEEILEIVDLAGRGAELAGALSGGEQQRAAIARALIAEPEIVLADEPTGSLDAYNADYILDLLERAVENGTTVVLATHDRMLMAARPHRTIALDHGRIVGMTSGSLRDIPDSETGKDFNKVG
jgi:cell division transport system ATP-binding protein